MITNKGIGDFCEPQHRYYDNGDYCEECELPLDENDGDSLCKECEEELYTCLRCQEVQEKNLTNNNFLCENCS